VTIEVFIDKKIGARRRGEIELINGIIDEYRPRGIKLNLRALFYQLVARGMIGNLHSEYKRVGELLKDARNAGLTSWDDIEDRTRRVRTITTWDGPAEIISTTAYGYCEDLWAGQRLAPTVWIEKDALVGVREGVCEELRVPYFSCRGNNSTTLMYQAGKRLESQIEQGKTPIVFHLGDHDPNGMDMTRDNRDRLSLYARQPVELVRLALNREQIDRYNPPPMPVKDTDSRCNGYVAEHGEQCWELDALDPDVLIELIRNAIGPLIDPEAWNATKAAEQRNKDKLHKAARNWALVEKFLSEGPDDTSPAS
jgi:hypothetical protein